MTTHISAIVSSISTKKHWWHGEIHILWLAHQAESRGAMVVLQRGCVIVGDGQRVPSLDEEVIVDPSMLVVVHQSAPVCSHPLLGV